MAFFLAAICFIWAFSIVNTIVMTGGTSGLGEVAARLFIHAPNTRLLLGARRSGPLGAEALPLDLKRLENVRSFASAVDRKLELAQINSLVLNAAALFPNADTRTVDGFETAFAVNHLAHYLLLRLLLPRLAQGATVILTTSSTHDPAEKTIIAPPLHANARFLAYPERDPPPRSAPVDRGRPRLFFFETVQCADLPRARRPSRFNGASFNHYRLRSRPHSWHRPSPQRKFYHQFPLETISACSTALCLMRPIRIWNAAISSCPGCDRRGFISSIPSRIRRNWKLLKRLNRTMYFGVPVIHGRIRSTAVRRASM
jgi:hypothetical protein